ncbi:MAG TPA: inositol monophosphatase [Sedimentisphaerales bacterium]|nr:inositol monophosphatase [Sedimentisphaerales bacterium]
MVLEHGNLSRMLETAVVAARLAGQRAMEDMEFVKASVKNGNELVTQADSRCQQIIIERIKETYPDHGFIAEEGDDGRLFKQPPRGPEPVWWIIDPIDGTNNFANGVPLFAVSIGALYEGKPIVGVIFAPAMESMFTAVKDGEAQLNGRRIAAGTHDMDEFSSISLDSHFPTYNSIPPWVCRIMERTRYRNLGSTALHMAYVAKGSFLANIASTPKLWDLAAGAIIGHCAGAVMTDWKGKEIFPLDPHAYQGAQLPAILANKKVHPQIVNLINA